MAALRRHFLRAAALALAAPPLLRAAPRLPLSLTLIGPEKARRLLDKAAAESWRLLPIGSRMIRIARELEGTPYQAFTLEIHDSIESPSANFHGLDCWTFFELVLAAARLLARRRPPLQPADLLAEIEHTRYRGGVCTGHYLARIHYLDEWFTDNARRGVVQVLTPSLGPAQSLQGARRIDEMTLLWKSYRYLRHDPSLLPAMRAIEQRLESQPFDFIPARHVPAAEARLQDGDIIGIVTHKPHVYCSHVGLALRDSSGVLRLMHASSTRKKVIIDSRLSLYLARFPSHAGIIAARPLDPR